MTNQIAKKFPDRDSLLQLLLAARAAGQPEEFRIKGTFSNSAETELTITESGTWTWPADSGLPPVEVRFVRFDGVLWKLDTIIDPAMKPWLLVDEPLTAEKK